MQFWVAGLVLMSLALGVQAQATGSPPQTDSAQAGLPQSGSPTQATKRSFRAVGADNPGREHECLVEPFMVTNVGSPVDGILEHVLVNRGDRVRKGQVVARLQSGVEGAAVALSRARVEFGRRRVDRNEALFAKELISAQERDELVTEVSLREQELIKDQELLRLRTIISPIDGVVVERRLHPGEFIRAEKSVVLKLAQINPLNVEVIAPTSLFSKLKVGMSGQVNVAPYLTETFKARVVVVDKVVDAASGTMGVRLQMPNPDNRIPAGVKCGVIFDM